MAQRRAADGQAQADGRVPRDNLRTRMLRLYKGKKPADRQDHFRDTDAQRLLRENARLKEAIADAEAGAPVRAKVKLVERAQPKPISIKTTFMPERRPPIGEHPRHGRRRYGSCAPRPDAACLWAGGRAKALRT